MPVTRLQCRIGEPMSIEDLFYLLGATDEPFDWMADAARDAFQAVKIDKKVLAEDIHSHLWDIGRPNRSPKEKFPDFQFGVAFGIALMLVWSK